MAIIIKNQTITYPITVDNQNIPNMVSQISNVLAQDKLNIIDMFNKSRGDRAYTIFDVNEPIKPELLLRLQAIKGVIRCRIIPPAHFI